MASPEVADPSRHYSTKLSDVERKMQMMMEMSREDGGRDVPNDSRVAPLLDALPVELVEKILSHAVDPPSFVESQVAGTNDSMRHAIATRNAANLCLVCQKFEQIVRPLMYRTIQLPHRKARHLLQTLEKRPELACHVRDFTLESRIWTSDINEDVILRLFLAVRDHCISMKVGANESTLLPYLFYGDPEHQANTRSSVERLHIVWRDDVDFDPRRRRRHRRAGDQEVQDDEETSSGETDDDAVADTLRCLFEHEDVHSQENMLGNVRHLVLDLLSHAQLAQLFLESGFFAQHLLPQLHFLRVELPLVVVQFAQGTQSRQNLARSWPCKRWTLHTRNIQDILDDRTHQNRLVSQNYTRRWGDENKAENTVIAHMESPSYTPDQCAILAPCAPHQLKALLMRFSLNVHKNDVTLFRVLLSPTPALDKPWSCRAAVSAFCLAATLQGHLGGTFNHPSGTPCLVFPLGAYQNLGPERYWAVRWEEAEKIRKQHLPIPMGGIRTHTDTEVSLLLRWPTAVDAFFHYSASV